MSNTIKVLTVLFVTAGVRGVAACPALGGTYQRSVGWFHKETLSVVQDRCRSVTLVYSSEATNDFDEASPRFVLDDAWHTLASGRAYRASVIDGQFVVTWGRADQTGDGPQTSLYLDPDGVFTLARVSERGRPEVLSYRRIETHEVPTSGVNIRFDEALGWHVTDAGHAPLLPLLEHVEHALDQLVKHAVYACDIKGERSRAKENAGLLVYDVNGCHVVDVVTPAGP